MTNLARKTNLSTVNRTCLLGAGIAFSLATIQVCATENGATYPPGGSKFSTAALPPFPGIYLMAQGSVGVSEQLNDENGDELPVDFKATAVAEAFRFLYMHKGKLFGASVGSQLVLPVVNVDVSLKADGNTIFDENHTTVADITITPIILDWNKDKWFYGGGVDIVAPTGAYDVNDNVNVGKNYWAVQTVLGFKYWDQNGLEFGASPRLSFNFENDETNYQTGTELVIDYAAGWHFGQWRAGANGYYYDQLTDDKQDGESIDDSQEKAFAIGPILTYQTKSGPSFTLSWQHDVMAENRSQGDTFGLDVSLKLF